MTFFFFFLLHQEACRYLSSPTMNRTHTTLQWTYVFLITGPSGKSPMIYFLQSTSYNQVSNNQLLLPFLILTSFPYTCTPKPLEKDQGANKTEKGTAFGSNAFAASQAVGISCVPHASELRTRALSFSPILDLRSLV